MCVGSGSVVCEWVEGAKSMLGVRVCVCTVYLVFTCVSVAATIYQSNSFIDIHNHQIKNGSRGIINRLDDIMCT